MKLNFDFWKEVCMLQGMAFIVTIIIFMGGSNPWHWTTWGVIRNVAIIDAVILICLTVHQIRKREVP